MSESTARERLVQWHDPKATVAQIASKSGLEAFRSLLAAEIPPPPIAQLMNMRLVEAEEGRVVFEATPGEEHYNPIGVVHGGLAMTLLDSALGCAVHTMLPAGVAYTSTDTQVRFIRPIRIETGVVRCEGRVLHLGRTTAIAEGTIRDANGKLLATGTSACAVMRPS